MSSAFTKCKLLEFTMRSDNSVLFLDTARSAFMRCCLSQLTRSPRPFAVRFRCRGPKESHNWMLSLKSLRSWSSDLLLSWLSLNSCALGSPGTFKLSVSSWWVNSAMHAKKEFPPSIGDFTERISTVDPNKIQRKIDAFQQTIPWWFIECRYGHFSLRNVAAGLPHWP